MTEEEKNNRWNRQLRLPEIGAAGQARLRAASVLVVGAGGLGSPVLQNLAAAGVGKLTIVDDDHVELSNLNRQTLHRHSDLGRRKAERAADWVRELDPNLEIEAMTERVGVHNARSIIASTDLTVDCTDGLPAKFLLQDAAVLEKRPLVHGAVSGWNGQVLLVTAGGKPCLRCLFAEIPPPSVVGNCRTQGVLGATCAWVGSVMALVALKALLGLDLEKGCYLSLDARALQIRTLAFRPRPTCGVCGDEIEIDARTAADYLPGES